MVYKNLRMRILSGEIAVGSPLSRRQVAAEYGVSIVPVGEALQRLQTEELVESRPRVGTRVRIPTTADVRGHYTVREALETSVTWMAPRSARPPVSFQISQESMVPKASSPASARSRNPAW